MPGQRRAATFSPNVLSDHQISLTRIDRVNTMQDGYKAPLGGEEKVESPRGGGALPTHGRNRRISKSSISLNKNWNIGKLKTMVSQSRLENANANAETEESSNNVSLPFLPLWPVHIEQNHLFTTLQGEYNQEPFIYDIHIEAFLTSVPNSDTKTSLLTRIFPECHGEEFTSLFQRTVFKEEEEEEKKKLLMEMNTKEQEWREFGENLENNRTTTFWSNSSPPTIKGGTFDDIVYEITRKRMSGSSNVTALLLTFRSYSTPSRLLELLIKGFERTLPEEGPKGADQADFLDFFHSCFIKPTQIQTGKILKLWVETHWYDFLSSPELIDTLQNWIKTRLRETEYTSMVLSLESSIEKKINGSLLKMIHIPQIAPHPLIPSSVNMIAFHPLEVARQLCLMEFEKYANILPTECIHQSWTKAEKDVLSPNISQIIRWANHLPQGLAFLLLSSPLKMRVKLIQCYIKIAEECNELNNFNSLMEILAALQLASVFRLKKTWPLVPKKSLDTYAKLKEIMAVHGNWKNYRDILKSRNPPCIPYLGVFLTDFTFIEDGNPDFLDDGEEIIHFQKYQHLSVVIQDLQQYQQRQYYFHPLLVIQDFLSSLPFPTVEELYTLSLEVEPRT